MGTGNTDYTFTAGFVTTKEKSETDTLEADLSIEMSVGIEFLSEKLNESVKSATTQQAQSTYQQSGGV